MWKNKQIFITGATGLIGAQLTKKLVDCGAVVTVCGRSEEKIKQIFAEQIKQDKLKFVVTDISKGFPESTCSPDYIFHAASPISGAEIKEKPVDTINANLEGTKNCLEFLKKQAEREKKGRLVIFSSATVYGNEFTENFVASEEETQYADALDSSNTPYSESKRMIEVLARAYNVQYNVDSVIVRIGYVYGYAKNMPKTAFYEFINKAIKGEIITLNNSGMGRRDNIYVEDVVRGLLIVAAKGNACEAYNISSAGEKNNFMAIDEIANIIAKTAHALGINKNKEARVKPLMGTRNPGLMLDNKKIKKLGWTVETNIAKGIEETIKKYMENIE